MVTQEALTTRGVLQAQTIDHKFREYHERHPEVYQHLVLFARRVKARGHERYSISALFERVRWHLDIEKGDEPFKIDNIYRSRYARLIMEREPDLKDFFELRELRAA